MTADDCISAPQSCRDRIMAMARQHGISVEPTKMDALGQTITRMAGDDAELDDVGLALVHLAQDGHISLTQSHLLLLEYLDECEA